MALPNAKIAILGAGPVGLTLAAILHRHGIPFHIFERNDSVSARSQGGTFDLHPNGGQKAPRAAGLLSAFLKVARRERESIRFLNENGEVIFDADRLPGPGEDEANSSGEDEAYGRPEIDRADLNQLLLDALPHETVRWNQHITSISPSTSSPGKWIINLPGGSAEKAVAYDLIVGADGAWSKVRPYLAPIEPEFSGITALDVWISDLDHDQETSTLVGQGSCFAFARDRALLFQRHGDGSARCYFFTNNTELNVPKSADQEIDWEIPGNREIFIRKWFGHFHPRLTNAVLSMKDRAILRPLYMLPVGFTWESKSGITLLGDAAHVMTPFAGRGVNVGMIDAVELGEGLINYFKSGQNMGLDQVVRDYELKMFKRSREDARITETCMQASFGEDRAREMGRTDQSPAG
ncbi:hypothetical protein SCUP515_12524 [Seiridium cupressi]